MDFASLTHDYHDAGWATYNAMCRADLERQRRALVPVEQAPCRAIVPVAHYVYPYRQHGGGLGFACQGVADPAPSWDAARWEAEFLEV